MYWIICVDTIFGIYSPDTSSLFIIGCQQSYSNQIAQQSIFYHDRNGEYRY